MKIGTLFVNIEANLARLKTDMADAKGVIENGMRDMQRSARNVQNSFTSVIAATGVGYMAKQILEQAKQAEQAQNRLHAVLRATAYQAGLTRDQLNEMAEAMADATEFDDESIRNAQSALLKFGNIHGDVFKRALALSADLASFMGTNIPEAAQMIGKTLQSPTEGLMMMERNFGKLTDAEENHIKTLVTQGKAIEAQVAVMELWERKVGGTSDLMNTGLTKATKDLGKAWNELLETLGKTDNVGRQSMEGLTALLRDVRGLLEGDGRNLKALAWETLGWIVDPTGLFGTRGVMERKAEKIRTTNPIKPGTSLADWMEPGPAANVALGGKGQDAGKARDLLMELSGIDKDFYKDLAVLHGEYAKGALTLEQYQTVVGKLVEKQKFAQELRKGEEKWLDETNKSIEERRQAWVEQGVAAANVEIAMDAHVETLERETRWMSLSNDQRERAIALYVVEQQELSLTADAYKELVDRINAVFDRREALSAQDDRIKATLAGHANSIAQAEESGRIFEQAVATGIMTGFRDSAGPFGNQLRRVIENAIITATLTPIATKIGGMFSPVGQFLSGGGGSMATSAANWLATSRFGQSMGWSTTQTDAADNITTTPNAGFGSSVAGAIPYIGAFVALAYAMRSRESRQQLDAPFAEMEAKLGGKGNVRARWNPGGAYLAGETTGREAFLGMAIPGLTSLGAKGSAMRIGEVGGGLGQIGAGRTHWFDWETSGGLGGLFGNVNTQEQNLIRNMGLSPEQIARVNAALPNRTYQFGMEHTPWEQSPAYTEIAAERIQAISSVLGRSIEDLSRIMMLSADQFLEVEKELQKNLAEVTATFGGFIRSLPQELGITALRDYQKSLTVAEFQTPLDRVAAARGIYSDTLERARGGELAAVQEFPQVVQQLLAIGREVYASGPEFQGIFLDTNKALDEVLAQQDALRLDIIKDVPATILETSKDEITELRAQTAELLEALNNVQNEIRLLREAA